MNTKNGRMQEVMPERKVLVRGESGLPLVRTRLSLALIAAVVVALELTMMRGLAIRLSSHFAGIVISVGLLGFGAAGSFLTLLRGLVMKVQRGMLVGLALLLALSVPLTWRLSQEVALNVNYLMWNLNLEPLQLGAEGWRLLEIELLMLVPFFLAGAFIGVVLMDKARRINGHYASDLLGSGAGGIAVVLLMSLFSTAELMVILTGAAMVAGFLLVRWRNLREIGAVVLIAVLAVMLIRGVNFPEWVLKRLPAKVAQRAAAWREPMPWQPAPNQYKPLTVVRKFEGTRDVYHAEGPLGRIDVVEGPMLHGAPDLSLQYFEDLPPHVEMYVDGGGPALIFDCRKLEDWAFASYRTAAAPYFVRGVGTSGSSSGSSGPDILEWYRNASTAPLREKVCVVGAGGGVDIGLGLLNHMSVTALEVNPQVIAAMRGPLKERGGRLYDDPWVRVVNEEARGFFASTQDQFDVIVLPPAGGAGMAGADATQESYTYTTQSIRGMLHHLAPGGVLALTRGITAPPREELRAFDLVAEALRQEGADPKTHLAMIRGSFSCTILVFKDAMTEGNLGGLKRFCRRMGFDPCYFPGITEAEANPKAVALATMPEGGGAGKGSAAIYGVYNLVDHPFYFTGPQALVGTPAEREAFLQSYLFDVRAPSDDKPYFFHTFKWSSYAPLKQERGEQVRNYLEVSYITLLVSLVQAVVLAAVLILAPLALNWRAVKQERFREPGWRGTLRRAGELGATFTYFLMLGLGFMLLEMGFVQKLVLYLSHPIYAVAVVIASFLVFAGIGSHLSTRWKRRDGKKMGATRVAWRAAIVTVGIALLFLLRLDDWLAVTQSWAMWERCIVAAVTIAPLACAMGHFFPLGLQRLAGAAPGLVPWAWAVNGFASVVAAAVTPLLAMWAGFTWVAVVAMACYVVAGVLFRMMPVGQPLGNIEV